MLYSLKTRCITELFGTFWLVLGGCGSAVFAGDKIGFAGVSLAFGLTVLTMAFSIGHISGCHLNPAVTVGLSVGKRFPIKDVAPYIVSQVIGALIGATVIYIIASGNADFSLVNNFAANGVAENSPAKYSLLAGFTCEVVMTFAFLMIIMGSTHSKAPVGFAPIAIGLGLTLIHLISIPVTNTSVNPARSTSQAIFVQGWALEQLWVFWVAPIIGAILAGVIYPLLCKEEGKA